MLDIDTDTVVRGAAGVLVAGSYTVVAAAVTLVPPVALVGARLNVAAWVGLVVAGVLAAMLAGFDVGRGDTSLRALAQFVVTAWVLLLPLGATGDFVTGVAGLGVLGEYLARLVGFGVATGGAAWMAYGGGWDRARGRMGSGGLDKM